MFISKMIAVIILLTFLQTSFGNYLIDDNSPFVRNDSVIDESNVTIPESFDARLNWPLCAEIISQIFDQSNCKSSWAVSVASAMGDRLCIKSDGSKIVNLSSANIIACGFGFQCMGGWAISAWDYWQQNGIVTENCQPYPLPPCDHYVESENSCDGMADDFVCYKNCTNPDYDLDFEEDLTYGLNSYWVYPNVSQIQLEIMYNGPVIGTMMVYDDFTSYKEGVYVSSNDSIALESQNVKIFGWGSENGVDYWLAANCWNTNWGDGGNFKILRGEDHCGIEGEVTAGIPNFFLNDKL